MEHNGEISFKIRQKGIQAVCSGNVLSEDIMKRSICIAKGSTVTAVAVCLLMVAAVSAVLVMMDSRSNRFSTGENISKIEEHFKLHNRMYPDSDYEKKMWVRNTGDVPCYVRVFAEVQDPDIREKRSR